MTRPRILTLILLLFTLGYAILRHNIFRDVPWEMLPLYTLNKALAWTGLSLLAFVFAARYLVNLKRLNEKWLEARKNIGKSAFNILGLHAILTLLLFRTEYGLEFIWKNDAIRAEGILSILLGSAALGFLAWYQKQAGRKSPKNRIFRYGALILLPAGAVHAAIWGITEWFHPSSWPSGMPPITLISSLTAILASLLILRHIKR